MATMQRFKLLATQCGVAQSPTRSPSTSPVVQLRRRKTTLRMLLSRRSPSRRDPPRIQQSGLATGFLTEKTKSRSKDMASHTLKDLFISSCPIRDEEDMALEGIEKSRGRSSGEVLEAKKLMRAGICSGLGDEPGSSVPVWGRFGKPLLRRAWRPVLATIPE